jgi:hypothetical protein
MNKKIIGGIVMTLLIATAFQAVGTMNKIINNSIQPPTVEWEKTFGGDEFDWFYCVEPTSDGGYIATGVTEESDINYAWLVKVDANGNEDWSSVNYEWYGTRIENQMIVSCVRETSDGGYIASGLGTYYNNFHEYWTVSGYLWKVNSIGTTEWLKSIINEEQEMTFFLMNIEEDPIDYGFYCAGSYILGSPSDYILDVGLVRTDDEGNLDWYQHYDAGGYDFTRSLDITEPDDGFFLSGTTQYNPNVVKDAFCMVKADSDGNKEMDKIYDGPGFDYHNVMGCGQTSNGGYITCGVSYTEDTESNDLRIIKVDESLNIEWDKTFGGPNDDRCYCMDITNIGYVFLVIKNAYINTGTKADLWVIQIDNNGNKLWDLLIEKEGIQWLQSIVQTNDNGYIIAGRNGKMENKNSDGLLIKVSSFENQRPNKPTKPSGPNKGKPDTEYTFSTNVVTDPDGDLVYYKWDWGDGNYSELLDTTEASYTWIYEDNFEIRVMAIDENGGESDWSDPLTFSTPKNKAINKPNINFLEKHPNLFTILRQLLLKV